MTVSMKYPLYILSRDDMSIRPFLTPDDTCWMEEIDVRDGMYLGWDSNGYPLKITWNQRTRSEKIELASDIAEPEVLRREIYRYIDWCAAYYREDEIFFYEKTSMDYLGLFAALASHIGKAPWRLRIRNLLRRLWIEWRV